MTGNNKAAPDGDGPEERTPIVRAFTPARNPERARAARSANVAWAIVSTRSPFRSHLERIRHLQAAGLVADEANFQRMAAPATPR